MAGNTDSLYVSNLNYSTTSEELKQAFPQCLEATVVMDRNTEKSKGFGFIKFVDVDTANEHISRVGGPGGTTQIGGREVKVNYAHSKEQKERTGMRGGGGNRGGFQRGGGEGYRGGPGGNFNNWSNQGQGYSQGTGYEQGGYDHSGYNQAYAQGGYAGDAYGQGGYAQTAYGQAQQGWVGGSQQQTYGAGNYSQSSAYGQQQQQQQPDNWGQGYQ